MRLRNLKANVKEQNWFAVFLDFLIVVLGVYLGIQLGNWNERHQTFQAFSDAKTRFQAETVSNLEATEKYLADLDVKLKLVRDALAVLRTCEDGEVARDDVETGVNLIRGTSFLSIRKTALSALTRNDDFLSLMDEAEREKLKEFEREVTQTQKTLDWLEQQPFKNHIEDRNGIAFGELVDLRSTDGAQVRMLSLGEDIEQLCQDREFLGAFYLWERTATFQMLRANQVKEKFLEIQI